MKVGDRIRVTTFRWERSNFSQHGKTGTIHHAAAGPGWWNIHLDEPEPGETYNYQESDMELIEPSPFFLPDPDMSLDEIHAFQDLVER